MFPSAHRAARKVSTSLVARRHSTLAALGVAALLVACSDSAGSTADAGTVGPGASPDGGVSGADASTFDSGTELRVAVPATGRVYVKLATPSVVSVSGDPTTSADWDLAFEGFDIFTNSGPSGNGTGGSFGPLDAAVFIADEAPTVPFISADKAGGAFLDWYAYEGTSHALWSRYHVYGVKEADRLFKVQIINYYGERDGAPVSALYKLRYAELLADGSVGPTQELVNVDGTAGGASAPASSPNECLDLGTGTRPLLTPDAALSSSAWDLSFRRANIGVNGERGGPRGTGAVDLSEADTLNETVEQVMARTDASEKARFDAVTRASFDGKSFRGDRIVSGFGEAWIDRKVTPLTPDYGAWLAVEASGKQKYLLGFRAFEGPTTTSPGTVVMRIKPVKG